MRLLFTIIIHLICGPVSMMIFGFLFWLFVAPYSRLDWLSFAIFGLYLSPITFISDVVATIATKKKQDNVIKVFD